MSKLGATRVAGDGPWLGAAKGEFAGGCKDVDLTGGPLPLYKYPERWASMDELHVSTTTACRGRQLFLLRFCIRFSND